MVVVGVASLPTPLHGVVNLKIFVRDRNPLEVSPPHRTRKDASRCVQRRAVLVFENASRVLVSFLSHFLT